MKLKHLFLLPLIVISFTSCKDKNPILEQKEVYTVSYMLNCPKEEISLLSGYKAIGDDLLYLQEEITLGQTISKPQTNPIRNNYVFGGWYTDKNGVNIWDFGSDIPYGSLFLYAKWNMEQEEEYVEPEYNYPEKIITDQNFILEGILNSPINNGKVNLANGAIKRLITNKYDVRFALNYARKETTEIKEATYDESLMKITVKTLEDGNENTYSCSIVNISASLTLSNSTYEQKALNYEENDKDATNYHIMLAGSSSMENWKSSKEDLLPIISYNHGIGGTTVDQWIDSLFERLVMPYSPKAVVFYVGVNNIINAGDNGTDTASKLVTLMNKVHTYLPYTQIFFVYINSLPGYMNKQNEFDIANAQMTEMSQNNEWLTCIDAGKPLLKENGQPNAAYFLTDGLHMSQYGYILWGAVIKQALIDWMK